MSLLRLQFVIVFFHRSIDDKDVCVGRGCEFEIRCPDCLISQIVLKGYPERGDYAAFRDKVRGIYNAFIIPVQNEGRVSLIADGERG